MPDATDPTQRDLNDKAISNERVKLLASTFNTVGLAFTITGAVVPTITLLYGGGAPNSRLWLLIGVWWVVIAILLHLAARRIFGGLKG